MALTEHFVERTITDRNGNAKTIKVKVAGDGVISKHPSWRGLEFGWTADDITPENDETAKRQSSQDWVLAHGGEIVARHVKIGRSYTPLVYKKNDALIFVTYEDRGAPRSWKAWAAQIDHEFEIVLHHRIYAVNGQTKHHFETMS